MKKTQGKFLTEIAKGEKTAKASPTFGWKGAVVKPEAIQGMNTTRRLGGHNAVAAAPKSQRIQKQYDAYKSAKKGDSK